MQSGKSSLADLARLREGTRRERLSSYDTAGGNRDWWVLPPGEGAVIAAIQGAGCIRHIWMTMWCPEEAFARKIVLRAWWEGEPEPSIECPVGDFFGIGHGIIKNFWSLPLQMSPQDGRAFNCWFPMPFATSARFEVNNESNTPTNLYFYIDYETYPALEAGYARFHAQWRRENPTDGFAEPGRRFADDPQYMQDIWNIPNLQAQGNYVILEAAGKGHYVGCHLDIDCFERSVQDWYGEGDDMILIDGEPLPRLYGTGTEDYFNTAFGPSQEFCTPYQGITVNSGDKDWPWRGKNSVYRYHIEDPIYFEKSIKVTIEHGEANLLSNDYSSTAYWYQTEPHLPFPPLLPVAQRLPRPDQNKSSP
jgi:D-arabinan exo alpha-(1,3)/(1,5)-arabinofuranosidase (non-reducing end)